MNECLNCTLYFVKMVKQRLGGAGRGRPTYIQASRNDANPYFLVRNPD
jgi:hypothetical protein